MRIFVHIHTRDRVRTLDLYRPDVENLTDRFLAALEYVKQHTTDEEEGHEFHGNQYVEVAGAPKPSSVISKGVKMGVHELLSSGHGFSLEELQKITGATTPKQISDALAMLKNPKYAGSKGPLKIAKFGNEFKLDVNTPTSAPKPVPTQPIEQPLAAPPEPIQAPVDVLEKDPAVIKKHADMKYNMGLNIAVSDLQSEAWTATTPEEKAATVLKFKETKAQYMANWANAVKGGDHKPKPQTVFKADLQLLEDIKTVPDQALKNWKSNTAGEKAGIWPPKPPEEIKAAEVEAAKEEPKAEPAKEVESTYEPIHSYVPENHSYITPSDFSGFGKTKFEKDMQAVKTKLATADIGAASNKKSVQTQLEDRLKSSPAFQAVVAAFPGGVYNSLPATLIQSWAATSGDHQAVSVANQLAVQEAFGMADEDVSYDALHLITKSGTNKDDVYKQAMGALGISSVKVDLPTFKAALKDFALAQYHNTQDRFKALGIKTLSIARGMSVNTPNAVGRDHLKLQPASSFSTNFGTAKTFSKGSTILFSTIPVEQCLGSYLTGFGCTSEHEVVVLAHPKTEAIHIKTAYGSNMESAISAIQQYMPDLKNAPPATVAGKPVGWQAKLSLPKKPKYANSVHIPAAKSAALKGDVATIEKLKNMVGVTTYSGQYMAQLQLIAAKNAEILVNNQKLLTEAKGKGAATKEPTLTEGHQEPGTEPAGGWLSAAPAHIKHHSLFDPDQYVGWKKMGKTDFQISKNLAAKKFALKKKSQEGGI